MRIAVLNWTSRRFGGSGTYLSRVLPRLLSRGHALALWHEVDEPADHQRIPLPADAQTWSVQELGLDDALTALRRWQPQVLFSHGLLDPAVEVRTLEVAPAIFFAHNYYGTCISGLKTFKYPATRPCSRTFGWPCLIHYYPRRCGGWSPLTMARDFRRQSARLDLLSRYEMIVTLSRHMRDEYLRHGLRAECVFGATGWQPVAPLTAPAKHVSARSEGTSTLLFLGRMDPLKGGRELLNALPEVVRRLNRKVHVTFAGDGSQRDDWERLAAERCAANPRIGVEFTGWIDQQALRERFGRTDLLVLPSTCPETFGLVGLEAAQHGVPSAAFAVGGIPEWLYPGVNGYLASGDPPTIQGLADAIVACLQDPTTHARLRAGASRVAAEFDFDRHVETLVDVFMAAAQKHESGEPRRAMRPREPTVSCGSRPN